MEDTELERLRKEVDALRAQVKDATQEVEDILDIARKMIMRHGIDKDDPFVVDLYDYGMKRFTKNITINATVGVDVSLYIEDVPFDLTDEQIEEAVSDMMDSNTFDYNVQHVWLPNGAEREQFRVEGEAEYANLRSMTIEEAE